MAKKYKPAVFQPTVRPSWVGIVSYISKEEQSAILEAILKYPNKTDIQSRFWDETIEPDLKAQYEGFTKSSADKGRAARDYWNKRGEDMLSTSLPKGEDILSISLPNDNHLVTFLKDKDKNKDKSKDKEQSKDNITQPKKVFVKPSVEQVEAYCQERNNGINAQQFVDFYTAKGWKIGSSPMKDWQAAVRNWERRLQTGEKNDRGTDYNRSPELGKYAGFGRKIDG